MGFWALSIVWYSKEHYIRQCLGNWICYLVQVREWETPNMLASQEGANPSHWKFINWISFIYEIQQSRCLPLPHLKTDTDPVSEMFSSVVFFIKEDGGKSPKTYQTRTSYFIVRTVWNLKLHSEYNLSEISINEFIKSLGIRCRLVKSESVIFWRSVNLSMWNLAKYIVTDLIKALPGNGSLNTSKRATT
jgi:hypothetical protein